LLKAWVSLLRSRAWADGILDLNESLSGSDDSSESDEDDMVGRKDSVLSALLKKQAALSESSTEDREDTSTKKRHPGSGKPPLFWFASTALPSNTYLGIYRALFTNLEQADEASILSAIRRKQLIPKLAPKLNSNSNKCVSAVVEYNSPHIFLCMIGGGHFAAMVVALAPKQVKSGATSPLTLTREVTVLAHKTFHRYTTRRKQGGSQSANDSAKGPAHSAGSSLRRYNEAALEDEVRLLLEGWRTMIDSSQLLFVRATGNTNRKVLFGPYDGQVLRHNDLRIRGFPFNTRRATQSELMRAFVELTRVKVQEIDETALRATSIVEEKNYQKSSMKKSDKLATVIPKLSEEEEIARLHSAQVQALIRRSKLPALLSYLKDNNLSSDFMFQPHYSQQNHHTPTPLHLAASQNSPTLVTGLLMKAGANPTLLSDEGKSAFDLAGDRATRDAFRVARFSLGESAWNWNASHITTALSRSEADERDVREKQELKMVEDERRKAEAERLKAEGPKVAEPRPLGKAAGRGRSLALGQVQKTAQEKRDEEARGLTPDMRMKLERERRARAAEERIRIQSGS
jgi:Bacteroidetes VLRF1 release factor